MNKQLLSVTWYTFKKKVFSKQFLIVHTIMFGLFMVAAVVMTFAIDSSSSIQDENFIVIIDQTTHKQFTSDLIRIDSTRDVEYYLDHYDGMLSDAKEDLLNKVISGIVIISEDDDLMPVFEVLTYDNSYVSIANMVFGDAQSVKLKYILDQSDLPDNAISYNNQDFFSRDTVALDTPSDGGLIVLRLILAAMLILLMVISMPTISTIGNDVIYEKVDRTMELIISSVDVSKIFISKIIVGFLLALTEILILALLLGTASMIGVNAFGNILIAGDESLSSILQTLFSSSDTIFMFINVAIFILLAFMFFLIFSIVFASFAVDAESGGYWMMPPMLIMVLSLEMVLFTAMENPNSAFVKIISYIPFTAGFAMPARMVMTEVSTMEVLLGYGSLVITLVLFYIIGRDWFARNAVQYSKRKKKKA